MFYHSIDSVHQWSSHFTCFSFWYILCFITALTQGHAWVPNSCLHFLLLWAVSQTLFNIVQHIAQYCHLWCFLFTFVPISFAVIDHCFWTIALSFIFWINDLSYSLICVCLIFTGGKSTDIIFFSVTSIKQVTLKKRQLPK